MTDARDILQTNIDQAVTTIGGLGVHGGAVVRAADALSEALLGGCKLLTCGNGGSAADAAHMTTEFVCRFIKDRKPFPAICLATHAGDITAIGNDYCFDDLFARQVEAFGTAGDVLLALSTSGNSENVRRAIIAGNDHGLMTIALLGRDGGAIKGLARIEMLVPAEVTARIQEAHKVLIHTICQIVDERLMDA